MRRTGAVSVMVAVVWCLAAGAASAAPFSALEAVGPHLRFNAAACGGTFCLVVGDRGQAATATDPTPTGSALQWHTLDLDGTQQLTGAACPSMSRCFAIDAHDVLTSAAPATPGSWHRVAIDPAHHLNAISCPSSGFCAAVDRAGGVLTSRNPTGPRGAWHRTQLAHRDEDLQSISCASSALCGAADLQDYVLVSRQPAAGASAWHPVRIAACSEGYCGQISRVTCFAPGGCAAIELNVTDFYVHVSSQPATARSWRTRYYTSYAHEGDPYGSLSCGSVHLCLEVDGGTMGGQVANLFTDDRFGHPAATLDFSGFVDPDGDPLYGTARATACGTVPGASCVLADALGNIIVAR